MTEFVDIAGADEVPNGQMRMFRIGEKELLVAHVGDGFYAADNRCPHMGGNLSGGRLEGTIVTCPRHHSQFDLTDGRSVRWTDWTGIKLSMVKMFRSPRPVRTYAVRVEGGRVLVEVEKMPAASV